MSDHENESLEKLHTKQLLNLLKNLRAKHDRIVTRYIDLGQEMRMYEDRLYEVRKLLATREHIPNQKEAKVIRQEKAKAKKNR